MAEPKVVGVFADPVSEFVYLSSGCWWHMAPVLKAGDICVVTISVWEGLELYQGARGHGRVTGHILLFNCVQMDCICDCVYLYVFTLK